RTQETEAMDHRRRRAEIVDVDVRKYRAPGPRAEEAYGTRRYRRICRRQDQVFVVIDVERIAGNFNGDRKKYVRHLEFRIGDKRCLLTIHDSNQFACRWITFLHREAIVLAGIL